MASDRLGMPLVGSDGLDLRILVCDDECLLNRPLIALVIASSIGHWLPS